MDKQNRIWALKDRRSDLSSTKSDVKWALSDDKSDYRELVNKIDALERRLNDLENATGYFSGGSFSWGASPESRLETAKAKLQGAKANKPIYLNAGPYEDSWEESNRLEKIRELNEDIEEATQEIAKAKNDIEEREREQKEREEKRQYEMTDIKGKLYRLRSNEQSLKLLIERREARIKKIDSEIAKINEQLRSLGDW